MRKGNAGLIALLCILILALLFTFENTKVAKAASFTSKYTTSVNGEAIQAEIYLKEDRTYIPIRKLTEALDYTIAYSRLDELDVYHNYVMEGAARDVAVWGNERWGYSIMQRVGEDSSPDDIYIYDPPLDCPSESDNCTVVTDKYEGPFIMDGTMYVPVRDLAEAFELNVSISKHHLINLAN